MLDDLRFELLFDTMVDMVTGTATDPTRYLVRATRYGFGVWDTVTADWWIPRLDMSRRDAGEVVAELEERVVRRRMADRN